MWTNSNWDWLILASAYVLGLGTFRLLGGMRAAGDAIRRWSGHATQ
jgi:hypothetical protein